MSNLIPIALSLFWAYALACLTYFLDFCLGHPGHAQPVRGRIFSVVGRWLARKYDEHEAKNIRDDRSRVNWFKALGVCPPCFNIWLGFIFSPLLIMGLDVNALFLLPALVISNHWLRKMVG